MDNALVIVGLVIVLSLQIAIHVRLSGMGQLVRDLKRYHDQIADLEKLLHGDSAGTVLRTEAGGGAVEIVIVTADVDRTREIAWRHVNHLGLSSRTTIRAEGVARRGGR